jgi:hypothetical protein
MADSSAFPTFDIEGRTFSKLILGHNLFLGGSYMSQARSRVYKEYIDDASSIFTKTRLLVTLNVGSIDGPSPFHEIGSYCVKRGLYVGQTMEQFFARTLCISGEEVDQ